MNGLDYVVIAMIAFGALDGFRKGALRMATSVVSLGAGIYAASIYYPAAEALVQARFEIGQQGAAILGYAAVFMIVVFGVQVAGSTIVRLVNLANLGWADRMAGAAIGGGILAVISGLCVMLLTAIMPPDSPIMVMSKLAPILIRYDEQLMSFVPDEAKLAYERNRDELIKEWLAGKASGGSSSAENPPPPVVVQLPEKPAAHPTAETMGSESSPTTRTVIIPDNDNSSSSDGK
ncbi:MAG TPA: CvpA family protein [Candidatus Binataceae bacterium]|nr:CvpA family protein [Candidatus Binataceae bacterium]